MKAMAIANDIRILKNCYDFFITSSKNCDDKNQTSLTIIFYCNIENVNLIQSWLWVVVDKCDSLVHKWVFLTNLTWNRMKHAYMSSSVEIYSIYGIWYFGHTQNSDKCLSGCNSNKKKWFQMFCVVQKFDQIST